MKLILISFNQQDIGECKRAPTDVSSIGIRYLSSYLKNKGHKVNMLFLPKRHGQRESRNELGQINDLISKLKPDLIGLSLMSNHFFRAKKLTVSIKEKFDIPVLWGGVHPTIEPINSLNHVDLICVGEGELAMEELLKEKNNIKDKNFNIQGIWYKKNDQVIENGIAQLMENIDNVPFPDYDLNDHYIVHKKKLVPFTVETLRQYYPASRGDHRLISSRGCPHACNYCCNSAFRIMYQGKHFRKRAVDGVISEMLEIKTKFPFIKFFKINDDTFLANTMDWLKEFNRQYKERIKLPFYCLASPSTIDKEKLGILVDAGLTTVQMGLQTGSDRINKEIYARNVSNLRFLESMHLFENHAPQIKVLLDLIVDNPYEKEEDILESIKILNQLKRGFNLALYSLAFYPGTELYNMATRDKILDNFEEYLNKEFHVFKLTYFNKLLYLIPHLNSKIVEKFVEQRKNPFVKIYLNLLFFAYAKKNKMPFWLVAILSKLKRISKKIL